MRNFYMEQKHGPARLQNNRLGPYPTNHTAQNSETSTVLKLIY